MRDDNYISQQSQDSYGISINYRFEPSYIRTVVAYAGTNYKPNIESSYNVNGSHYHIGAGWTNTANTLSLDAEYLNTDPYYDAFQLYYQPLGNLNLGGTPSGTPLAFVVVPAYFGGFPGSYIPFGYQLHDSGLYPNNRDGIRFRGYYSFLNNKAGVELRLAFLQQHTASVQQLNTSGVVRGMTPGFIDSVFYPLKADGRTTYETPKGREENYGITANANFNKNFKGTLQYDRFNFTRNTSYDGNTAIAKTNRVKLGYDVFKLGLDYAFNDKFSLNGGLDYARIKGYHPGINLLLNGGNGVNADRDILDVEQTCPYLGFSYNLSKNVSWTGSARYIDNADKINNDGVSPESYNGYQFMTQFQVKF
jgi:hypothetical protein